VGDLAKRIQRRRDRYLDFYLWKEITMTKKQVPDKEMRILYFIGWDDMDMEGFFEVIDSKIHFITGWSRNDAGYRSEYMDGLLNYLGVGIETLPKKYNKEAKKVLAKAFGLED
jgi:hypothetical protein